MATGLMRADIIERVVDAVLKIEKDYLSESTNDMVRLKLLCRCIFENGLKVLNIPLPKVEIDNGLGEGAEYRDWTLAIGDKACSYTLVKAQGAFALREALDTLYHETRHHEQTFRLFYYHVMLPKNLALIKYNKATDDYQGKSLAQILVGTFGFPEAWAARYAEMLGKKFRYTTEEDEETKKWYEESQGAYRNEDALVRGEASGKKKTDPKWALYRTLLNEDDGFACGNAAGDRYMTRTLSSRRGILKEKWEALNAQKAALENLPMKIAEKGKSMRTSGGMGEQQIQEKLDAMNRQYGERLAALKTQEEQLKGIESGLDRQAKKHEDDQAERAADAEEFRYKAYDIRLATARGDYMGSAVPRPES